MNTGNNNSPLLDTQGLPRPDPHPELDTSTYQILENTLPLVLCCCQLGDRKGIQPVEDMLQQLSRDSLESCCNLDYPDITWIILP